MAEETALELFQGEDKRYIFTVLNKAKTVALDITGQTLAWMVKRYNSDADANALLSKSTTAGSIVISGVFNSSIALNTQVATVTVDDTDTYNAGVIVPAGLYGHELKRMDPGFETVLSFGNFNLKQGVIR